MAADNVESHITNNDEEQDIHGYGDDDTLSPVQRRKREKNLKEWKMSVDFLLRHIAIITYKYNCFERDRMVLFMSALDKSESLRALNKLQTSESSTVTSMVKMREHAAVLEKERYSLEADVVRTFIDLVGRMRSLSTMANGLFKALEKGKVQRLHLIKYALDHWKGFCVRTFNFSQLLVRNVNISTLNDTERRYIAWPAVLRTSIHLAQTFLKRVCDATGLVLISSSDVGEHMLKHMQTNAIILAVNMKEMLFERTAPPKVVTLTAARKALPGRPERLTEKTKWTVPSHTDVDAALLRPIDDCSILLALPEVPLKEEARKKQRARCSKNESAGKQGKRKKSATGTT